jgi:hypothetical protein
MYTIQKLAQLATGNRSGDYLTLENTWARVHITRDTDSPTGPAWVLTGDVRVGPRTFSRMSDALTHALDSLALYEEGRCD